MTGNIILWGSMIWIPILMYVMLANETKFKKNIAVGVTLPFEGRSHPEVLARLEKFKKQELLVCIALAALGVPGLLFDFADSFTLCMWWILLMVTLPYLPYVLCNRDLKRIKAEQGWKREQPAHVTVDLSAVSEFRWLSPRTFVPAVVISLLPLLWERDYAPMYLITAALAVLCWLGYRYLFRRKSETVDDNTAVTRALTRIRQQQWGRVWLLCAYSMAFLNVGISLTPNSPLGQLVFMAVFTAVICGASIYIEFRTRHLQEMLTADSGRDFYVDDDDKWLGGMVYYNPNDSRLIINDRVGINSGVNLAKPAGKVMYALLALLLLSMPLIPSLIGGDPTMTVTETELLISEKYTVPLTDIEDVTLLTDLPEGLSRVMGTGMPNYLAGKFSAADYGRLELCLDPTAPPFLLIKTADRTYLAGTRDAALTEAIYKALN